MLTLRKLAELLEKAGNMALAATKIHGPDHDSDQWISSYTMWFLACFINLVKAEADKETQVLYDLRMPTGVN